LFWIKCWFWYYAFFIRESKQVFNRQDRHYLGLRLFSGADFATKLTIETRRSISDSISYLPKKTQKQIYMKMAKGVLEHLSEHAAEDLKQRMAKDKQPNIDG